MKIVDILIIVAIAVLMAWGVTSYSRNVNEAGRVLDEQYHIVCPEDGGQCYPVKNE